MVKHASSRIDHNTAGCKCLSQQTLRCSLYRPGFSVVTHRSAQSLAIDGLVCCSTGEVQGSTLRPAKLVASRCANNHYPPGSEFSSCMIGNLFVRGCDCLNCGSCLVSGVGKKGQFEQKCPDSNFRPMSCRT